MPKDAKDVADDEFDDDYDETDYCLIIGADGALKSMIFPADLMEEPPSKIKRILKILGIKDIHDLEDRTLH